MFYLYFIQQLIDLYFFDTNEAIFNLLFFTYIFNLLLYKESSFLFFFLIISFELDFEKGF